MTSHCQMPKWFWFFSTLFLTSVVGAKRIGDKSHCTAIAIDGGASHDGSAFAGMNADSSSADFRLTYIAPHKPMGKRPVYTFNLSYPRYVGYARGPFFHPKNPGDPLYQAVGYIPETEPTYGYYEATEPLMNEHGLGAGESSCACSLLNKFPGDASDTRDVPTGLLDTVTLMQLALERCRTSRCAVDLLGSLVEEFGFVPTPGEPSWGQVHGRPAWDDAGEAYTFADATGEAWVFHVVGGVTGVTKSVWAAQRVPKGHIAIVPNDFIIKELPKEPNEEFRFNRNIRHAALKAGLWDGKSTLDFQKTFSPEPTAFESTFGGIPIPLYCSLRQWGLQRLAAPSLDVPFRMSNRDYAFSVKVEHSLTHRDVFNLYRHHYEGTEFDMTQGMLAGPYGSPFRNEGLDKSIGQVPRGISIARTVYGTITQTGPSKSLLWNAMDTPTTSVYVPLFPHTGETGVSKLYSSGNQHAFSRQSAWWTFNFVSTFMQLNYRAMITDVGPLVTTWQDKIDQEMTQQTERAKMSTWQVSVQERVHAAWLDMSDFLIMKYNDGLINYPTIAQPAPYPVSYLKMIGFSQDIHPVWVQPASSPQHDDVPAGYVAPKFSLPTVWNPQVGKWSYESASIEKMSVKPDETTSSSYEVVLAMGTLGAGVLIGRVLERRLLQRRSAGNVELLG